MTSHCQRDLFNWLAELSVPLRGSEIYQSIRSIIVSPSLARISVASSAS